MFTGLIVCPIKRVVCQCTRHTLEWNQERSKNHDSTGGHINPNSLAHTHISNSIIATIEWVDCPFSAISQTQIVTSNCPPKTCLPFLSFIAFNKISRHGHPQLMFHPLMDRLIFFYSH